MDDLISIIIPVYQVEKYLEKCLNSIINQTYKNLEIILVDDGSRDKSGLICDTYAEKDKRIKVIHKENGGLVSARKAGMKVASGNLVAYIDSDDYVELDMYERMHDELIKNSSEVVICAHYEEFPHKILDVKNYVRVGNYRENDLKKVFSKMLYAEEIGYWGVSPACWDKLFKRELIENLQMRVDEKIWDGEDHAFIYAGLLKAKGITIIEDTFYHHVIRTDSVATAYDKNAFERFNKLYLQCKDEFENSEYWDECLKQQFPYQMRWFLHKHIYAELGIPAMPGADENFGFLFPFDLVEKGERVVIYGAGEVGREFYKQLLNVEYCKVAAWISKDYKTNKYGRYLKGIDYLKEIDFDKIVISVIDECVAEEIKKEINDELGFIDKNQVIWRNPFCKGIKI